MSTWKGRSPPCTRQAPKARESRKRVPPCARHSADGRGGGVTCDGHVEVGHRAPQQRVADAAAHRPGPLAEGREWGGQRVECLRHPRGTRGTRGPIAQVTS